MTTVYRLSSRGWGKHTPGPWIAAETGVYAGTLSAHGNFYVAALPFPTEEPSAEDVANLRLIAAAPELLHALKGILEGTSPNWVDVALAAIAKAEGGTISTTKEAGGRGSAKGSEVRAEG